MVSLQQRATSSCSMLSVNCAQGIGPPCGAWKPNESKRPKNSTLVSASTSSRPGLFAPGAVRTTILRSGKFSMKTRFCRSPCTTFINRVEDSSSCSLNASSSSSVNWTDNLMTLWIRLNSLNIGLLRTTALPVSAAPAAFFKAAGSTTMGSKGVLICSAWISDIVSGVLVKTAIGIMTRSWVGKFAILGACSIEPSK